ncbi:MAG: hypothetical protein QOE38_614 [Thermoleophilaceae bacterium]|nr:hypothetical protein [Thermoleophilaceae bacterium]
MFSKLRSGLTYANVIATLALFLALGGGAYAAFKLPANSVGSKQIKANAVNSSKVKNGSLLAGDFKGGQLPAGPQGLKGDKGDPCPPSDPNCQGPKGDTGPRGPGAVRVDYTAPGHDAAGGTSSVPVDTVAVMSELTIKASCLKAWSTSVINPQTLRITLVSSVAADVNWSYAAQTDPNNGSNGASTVVEHADGANLTAGQSADLTTISDSSYQTSNGRSEGEIVYRNATRTIAVTFHAMAFGAQNKCEVEALAVPSP